MQSGYQRLERCRVSGSCNLIPVLHLGGQELTGVFPHPGEAVTRGPLELVWCPDSGLLQLGHSFDPGEMYGDNYGYRSGLNASMVRHLTQKVHFLDRHADLKQGDTVLDIGSNDVIAHGVGPGRRDQATTKLPPMRSRMASRAGFPLRRAVPVTERYPAWI